MTVPTVGSFHSFSQKVTLTCIYQSDSRFLRKPCFQFFLFIDLILCKWINIAWLLMEYFFSWIYPVTFGTIWLPLAPFGVSVPWQCHGSAMAMPWQCHGTAINNQKKKKCLQKRQTKLKSGTAMAVPWHSKGSQREPNGAKSQWIYQWKKYFINNQAEN